jgi:hypothetical protein
VTAVRDASSTFADNARLPVHRWFRFTAGFSADWAKSVVSEFAGDGMVLDPFAGSGTALLAAEEAGARSCGVEAHPFFFRVAKAKLAWRSDPDRYLEFARTVLDGAASLGDIARYPELVRRCYGGAALAELDGMRRALDGLADGSPAHELAWLTLVGILRRVARVKSAQWQYVLPSQIREPRLTPAAAFDALSRMVVADMRERAIELRDAPAPRLLEADSRSGGFPGGATLVLTSPPYANNYDYADAARLEMSFLGEVGGWGDLRSFSGRLVRSCTQHAGPRSVDLGAVLSGPEVEPIRGDLERACTAMDAARRTHGGKKNYHLMIAAYFHDMARVWGGLRAACAPGCRACFVVGDSAPYGVHVPVAEWLGRLAVAAGFAGFRFERTRDRNVKWRNRKHRVPLCEGRLWVDG